MCDRDIEGIRRVNPFTFFRDDDPGPGLGYQAPDARLR